jgi:hypothetical protein
MTMANVNRRFEPDEAVPGATAHANGKGKASATLVQPEGQDADDLTPAEEQQLAGFNPDTPQLISAEYRLKQDQEGAIARPLAERASVRLGSVVGVVGAVMGTGAIVWFGFLQPRPPLRQATPSAMPTPTTPPSLDETAELKSRLAFQDQKQQLSPEPVAKLAVTAPPKPKAPQPKTPARAPMATAPPVAVARPEPVVMPSPVSPPERIQPVESVDPVQRWAQLANMGQLRVSSGALESTRTASRDRPDVQPAPDSPTMQQNPVIPVVSIGATAAAPTDQMAEDAVIPMPSPDVIADETVDADVTPSNRTPVEPLHPAQNGWQEVAIATAIKAKVTLPMIWAEGDGTTDQATPESRFAVELTEDMKATDGTVALPAGTVLVMRAQAVGRGNDLVSASAIAVVYRDRTGQIRQQSLPPDSLQIRGQGNRPLVAQKLNDVGPEIARQDLLIGLLSSLGRVGGIVNQPRTQSSTVTSGGNFNQSVSTTSPEPQLWAAAVEGFFNPIAERLSHRSEQTMQELLQRPNVQFVPAGTEVSVVVNSFLRIDR